MKKNEKIKLIGELVEHAFSSDRYKIFLKEVLKGDLLGGDSELVGELVQESEKIGLFQIECRELKNFFKGGRIQRNYLASLMRTEYKHRYKRAIAAFYSEDEKLWRLSLISKDEAHMADGIEPYRMTSHVMGTPKMNIAALEAISQYLEKPKKKGKQGIDLIFDQDNLMEVFFRRYSSKFFSLKNEVEASEELLKISQNFEVEKEKLAGAVAKKVMVQLVSLYFIQRKGWLGATKEAELEDGNQHFLRDLYNKCIEEGKNFFTDYLLVLYRDGFSDQSKKDNYMKKFNCKVPYFNVELFKCFTTPEEYIKIDNKFFYDDGEGILDLFDMYYFSLTENEPYLQDMVVEPEMIGKVFENLLETDYRKSKGTYYTPRNIVHYMCKKTLVNYLYTNLDGVEERDIKNFIFIGEVFLEADKAKVKEGNIGDLKLPNEIYSRLDEIEMLLKKVRVVEPSVGSGAFLLGMLGELLKRRKIIAKYRGSAKGVEKLDNYSIKKEIIKDNLYGTDIDYLAVESSKLRIWLSLIVDAKVYSEEVSSKSLGNIVQGNSLTQKWEEVFPDVVAMENGFDIVIGNPPYVGEKGNKEIFREIAKSPIGLRFYQGRGDLFYFFFHLGLDILKEKGTLAYITTNYYITADGAVRLRKDIKDRSNILNMVDFNEISVFSKAKGQHNIITILEKSMDKDRLGKTSLCNVRGELTLDEMSMYLSRRSEYGSYSTLKQSEFFDGEKSYIRLEKNKISEILQRVSDTSVCLKEILNINQGIVSGADKVTQRHIDKFDIDGVKGDGIFVLTLEEVSRLNLTFKEKKFIGSFYKNSHIERYISDTNADRKIIYITKHDKLEEYPNIERHLLKYKKVLEDKREARLGRLPWYSLHWYREREIFLKEKIVAPQRSRRNVFAYNAEQWYASADVYYMTLKNAERMDLKYILALLNSKLYYIWLYKRGKRKGELLELYATPLEGIPVKDIGREEQKKFIILVDRIMEKRRAGSNTAVWEREIDELVCDLYDLTPEERKEVYDFHKSKVEE